MPISPHTPATTTPVQKAVAASQRTTLLLSQGDLRAIVRAFLKP
ncbi:MAG: hypothetical protein AAGB05_13800 [Pseudomonadota bacterium]